MQLDLTGKSAPEQLRILRVARKLDQRGAADLLDISPASLSNLETGARTPSLDLAARIEREFGIPPASWVIEHLEKVPA